MFIYIIVKNFIRTQLCHLKILLSPFKRQKGSNIMPVQEKEKFTLTVDESDILTLSQKIQKYKDEDKAFSESLEKYLANPEEETKPLTVGSTTNALAISGANPELKIIINPSTIKKCMSESSEHYHGHGLSADIMKQLPEQLRNPAMIFKGSKDNSLVAITELKDKENHEIMIAVSLSDQNGFREVNRISSVYGKEHMKNYLESQIEKENLIACNTEKAEEMLHSKGLQLPKENTFFSYDNSIAYSDENVKTVQSENFRENTKKLLPFLNMKYRYHLSQIDNFNEKKAECNDKINYRQAKIDKFTDKANILAHTNKILKSMFGDSIISSVANAYIKRNEAKIKKINEERIPKHSKKIDIQNEKIKQLDHKIEVKQCKADKMYHLSNLIKSFFILNGAKRHKQFTTSLEGLNNASQRSLKFKLDKCNANIYKLNERYHNTESSVSKLDISHKLNDWKVRQSEFSNKLKKLQKVSLSIADQPFDTVEMLITRTEKQINDAIRSDNLNVAELADDISVSSAEQLSNIDKTIEKENSEFSHQEAENTNNSFFNESVEAEDSLPIESVADDISVSSVEYLQNSEKSLEVAIESTDDFVDTAFHKEFIDIENSDGSYGKEKDFFRIVTIGNDGKVIPYNDSVFDNKDKVRQDINNNKNLKEITYDELIHKAHNRIMESKTHQINEDKGEILQEEKTRKTYEKINPEYFESLKNKHPELDNRYTKKMGDNVADFAMQQLKEQGIMFSAVRLANDITGVTVHKDNHKALDIAMNKGFQVHKEKLIQDKKQAKSFNSEYYLSLPKENRLIAEFSSSDSNQYINALEAENCKYSYRIKQTDRIAVTIDNRDDKAIKVYENFLNNLEIPDLKNYLLQEGIERGFSNEQTNYIQDLMEKSSFPDRALYAFTEKIKPAYSDEQISDIYNKVSEIYAQPELDRIQDNNGLYNQLGEMIKNFDYDVNLKQLSQHSNFNDEQKAELLNALKSDISVESLCKIDNSYSADEIHRFVDVYKTYDMDKIDGFFKNHNNRLSEKQSKKTFSMSRNQMKNNAEKVGNVKHEPKAKAVEHSI